MLAKGSISKIIPIALFTIFTGTAAYLLNLFYLQVVSYAGIAVTVFSIWFFRDPVRHPKKCNKCMVSPADGKVIDIRNRTICIFMNFNDVHVNRTPLEGEIIKTSYTNGSFLPAFYKDSEKNERNEITIKTEYGNTKVTQIAGLIARRIITYVDEGDLISQGQRIGMICFGSRVDVTVPDNFDIVCDIKDKVTAGESIIAKFNSKTNTAPITEDSDEYIPDT
ncbi:phosphatidylserine decarboxylase related protein [Methanohalobium evestigatum Z-7303]|uniref:Putative archaetidylserine decarboxylase proenzyme n=1 Tax=Methanohalobium evestigatum (strain ATCC BAA-1072 / DSM 3721 / NBRC 107634 / OCM 161 / Z-7303) TaxID=644295 RepID=D7E954_METEZ|nr:phosphatidylserine decarboxylase [Methanohalobium evestigatum]ADI74002.1 phosphatidylserine decarboxylase related protein [Methanohalobium evestigatum Z-7303]